MSRESNFHKKEEPPIGGERWIEYPEVVVLTEKEHGSEDQSKENFESNPKGKGNKKSSNKQSMVLARLVFFIAFVICYFLIIYRAITFFVIFFKELYHKRLNRHNTLVTSSLKMFFNASVYFIASVVGVLVPSWGSRILSELSDKNR